MMDYIKNIPTTTIIIITDINAVKKIKCLNAYTKLVNRKHVGYTELVK